MATLSCDTSERSNFQHPVCERSVGSPPHYVQHVSRPFAKCMKLFIERMSSSMHFPLHSSMCLVSLVISLIHKPCETIRLNNLLQKGLETSRRVLGAKHGTTVDLMAWVGEALWRLREDADALSSMQDVFQLRKEIDGLEPLSNSWWSSCAKTSLVSANIKKRHIHTHIHGRIRHDPSDPPRCTSVSCQRRV